MRLAKPTYRQLLATSWVFLILCTGCNNGAGPSADSAPTAPAEGVAAPAPAPAAAPGAATDAQEAPEPAAASPAGPAAEPMPANDAGGTEKAAAGVGAKGRDYGGEGFVTTPVQTYFITADRIVFEAQIPKNLQLYKAEHNNKGPKSNEEFMKVIIQEGGVNLPELPAGDTYWYDPKTEEFMVRHPKSE